MAMLRWISVAAAGLIVTAAIPRQACAALELTTDSSTARSERADSSDFEYEVELEAASDYVFRGIDQTFNRPAGFLDANISWKSFYIGGSTSNINYRAFGDRKTNQEVDAYAGYTDEAFGFGYDVGVISYNYLNQPGGLNYVEGYIHGSRAIGPLRFELELNFDPNATRPRRGDIYGEGKVSWRITPKWMLEGDLPLIFHPARTRVSALVVTPSGAV